ncbi:MAG: hypothetical protein AABY10_05975, partial [Nanoarchaeota archaeon]
FEERASALRAFTHPCAFQSLKTLGFEGLKGFGTSSLPEEKIEVSGVTTPSVSAARACRGFIVEPGL